MLTAARYLKWSAPHPCGRWLALMLRYVSRQSEMAQALPAGPAVPLHAALHACGGRLLRWWLLVSTRQTLQAIYKGLSDFIRIYLAG